MPLEPVVLIDVATVMPVVAVSVGFGFLPVPYPVDAITGAPPLSEPA